jgi:signal transduction histidine kinase
MSTHTPWRERLLGSLMGQLQLATYLAVFLGFTGASTAGLWLSQRSQFLSGEAELTASASSLETCLLAHNLLTAREGEAASQVHEAKAREIRQELRDHSSVRTTLWIEQSDGQLLLPTAGHLPNDPAMLHLAMAANPQRQEGSTRAISVGGQDYVTLLHRQYPSGLRLWSSAEITSVQRAQGEFLNWMIVIWGSCLVLSLAVVSHLVRRIIRPLQQLSDTSAQLTADTLTTEAVEIANAPVEVTQLARTYNDLVERLAESWNHQRQFVSAVSHELRTPLTIVQGYLHRTLKRGSNLDGVQRQGLGVAEEESLRMGRLINDLLDLSRGDSGQLQVSCKPVSMADTLQEAINLARTTTEREIQLELPDGNEGASLVALADGDRLRQVLLDLIENADKYSPEHAEIRVRLRRAGTKACVEVEDDGIGIPADELEHVFERFRRASNSSQRSGTGLGLSIVKLLVEAMEGEVSVRSELGRGSCFVVQLPLADPAQSIDAETSKP